MKIAPASVTELDTVITWIGTAEQCCRWAGPLVTFPLERQRLAADIAFEPANAFCGLSDIGVLAFGQLMPKAPGVYHLARIISHPSYRGQGLARQFCLYLLDHAWASGASAITLNVYRANTYALNLYTTLGFAEQADKSDSSLCFMLKTHR
ncbi:hypothetical protein WG68_05165 [Arsukibacterium ikkense]|uniref:N-acetyltransferase domain-containing protein n=1 Tax=Arsukibacterium ikkense TaxID=336831 RepID=A0A0M2VAL8_9GAMM|nr:GNAT family N-acetyltransferase [Arsukibacterium ikkense]KKO46675.1 hypothetical protein WG68_05165 [Arsukibacterium ikkense]